MPGKDSSPKRSLLLMATPSLKLHLEAIVHAGIHFRNYYEIRFSRKDLPNLDDVQMRPGDEQGCEYHTGARCVQLLAFLLPGKIRKLDIVKPHDPSIPKLLCSPKP